jgi:hypothetical protein
MLILQILRINLKNKNKIFYKEIKNNLKKKLKSIKVKRIKEIKKRVKKIKSKLKIHI